MELLAGSSPWASSLGPRSVVRLVAPTASPPLEELSSQRQRSRLAAALPEAERRCTHHLCLHLEISFEVRVVIPLVHDLAFELFHLRFLFFRDVKHLGKKRSESQKSSRRS